MIVKKNKDNTFDLKGVSAGKLMAIVNAIDRLENTDMGPTAIQKDVRDIIRNNKEYNEAIKG